MGSAFNVYNNLLINHTQTKYLFDSYLYNNLVFDRPYVVCLEDVLMLCYNMAVVNLIKIKLTQQ